MCCCVRYDYFSCLFGGGWIIVCVRSVFLLLCVCRAGLFFCVVGIKFWCYVATGGYFVVKNNWVILPFLVQEKVCFRLLFLEQREVSFSWRVLRPSVISGCWLFWILVVVVLFVVVDLSWSCWIVLLEESLVVLTCIFLSVVVSVVLSNKICISSLVFVFNVNIRFVVFLISFVLSFVDC